MRFRCIVAGQLLALGSIGAVFADADSVAAINAVGLRRPDGVILTGESAYIGQVDVGRAGIPGFDSAANTHPSIIPFESKNSGGSTPAGPDDGLAISGSLHGLRVAGIMIAGDGVAPEASLVSAGWVHPLIINDAQLLTTQYVAKKYTFTDHRHIQAINQSWLDGGVDPFAGNQRLTLGMDWMASKFDFLNVVSGPYAEQLDVLPADNFNGVTVAYTSKDDGFHRVGADNDNDDFWDADGDRVSVDLLAPGEGLTIANAGGGVVTNLYGTSYAAPHVTGAVALLAEYSDYQIYTASDPRWDVDNPRRHEVLKAVLLNSAEKFVVDEGGNDWDDSEAYFDDTISLDQQMGAGLLDVGRAVAQFAPGEYNVFEQIPPIGWDWGETGGFGSPLYEYPFADELPVGKITITLAWDRRVTKTSGLDNTFDPSDGFTGHAVDNLDLFLLPAGATDPDTESIPLLRSWSEEDNVEHIYADIPEQADYKIVVYQRSGDEVDYGLAWWTGNPADFDKNGAVNGDDLDEWASDYGTSGSDADYDSDTDGNDFLIWQRNLGVGIPAVPVSMPVPESRSSILCATCIAFLLARRKRMNRAAAFLLAGASVVGARPADAANIDLVRSSRPVTSQEAAGGAPANGMVHDFYVTSTADLLVLGPEIGVPVYKHPYNSNHEAPDPELVTEFPAVGASSFLRLPSSTVVLGGGFTVPGSAWGDLSNDGPQNNFLFGRLTTTQSGTFAGSFYLRGEVNPITVPFTLSLPGPGESLLGATDERLSVSAEEWRPAEPPAAPVGPDFNQSTSPDFRGDVSVEITRRSRPLADHEWISKNGGGYVHEFYVTTATDLISVGNVEIGGKLYQHTEGSDRKPPNERVLKNWPGASADSFITTPGRTRVLGGGFKGSDAAEIIWYDEADDGPLTDFRFAQLTVDETGSFAGEVSVRGPKGLVSLPFKFTLPGNEKDLALLDGEQSYRLALSFDDAAGLAAAVPEPSAFVLCTAWTALALVRRRR